MLMYLMAMVAHMKQMCKQTKTQASTTGHVQSKGTMCPCGGVETVALHENQLESHGVLIVEPQKTNTSNLN
jgi:hypothetical protein